jgi:hypothetical protein
MLINPIVTPLSDLMVKCEEDKSSEAFNRLCLHFLESAVGVMGIGAPTSPHPQVVTSTAENPLKLACTTFPDGKQRVLAFADPPEFAKRFGLKFNATMPGRGLCETVRASPDGAGILLNSALHERSIIISREYALRLLAPHRKVRTRAPTAEKPWWKFW